MIPTVTEQTMNGLPQAEDLEAMVDELRETNKNAQEIRQIISSTNGSTEKPPTPQERLQAFGQELTALCQKYGVEMRPFIKAYNTGQQIADVEFVAVGK